LVEKKTVTNNFPLREGKGHMYEGGVRVPAIIVVPDMKEKGKVIDSPIISMDYYPTLLDLAKIKIDKKVTETWDGISLMNLINGNDSIKRNTLFWHYPHYHIEGAKPYSAIRKDNYKLIRFFEEDNYELYDLEKDISESNNIVQKFPEKAEELKKDLFKWYDKVGAQMPELNSNYNSNRN